jgi:single-strand DNA-binding protein
MNNITIAGQLGKDAEVRFLQNGDAVANFSVADSQGKDKPTIWWNASLFGKRAESLTPYLLKGQAVTVTGTVTEREYVDKEGNKRKSMDVRVNDVALQGGKREAAPEAPARQATRPAAKPAPAGSGIDDMDSDIPFLFNMNTVCDTIGTSKALLRCKYGKGLHILQVNRPDF